MALLGKCDPCRRPRGDKRLQVGFLVEGRVLLLHDFHPVDSHLGDLANLRRIVDDDPADHLAVRSVGRPPRNINSSMIFCLSMGLLI